MTLYVLEREFSYVHPDETFVRDWIFEKKGKFAKNDNPERHITQVNLSKTSVSDEDIPNLFSLMQLECLKLSNTHITDNAVPYINKLITLKYLDISDTQITHAGILNLELPELIDLNVTYDHGLLGISSKCPKLENIWRMDKSVLVQKVSSAPKPQISDAISGENMEVEQTDTKKLIDAPIEK